MLSPTIVSVEPAGCYGATITLKIHEKMWSTERAMSGFVVGIRRERNDDLPNMNHVDMEVFFPNENSITNHMVTLNVTQLLPSTSYKFNVCCLFPQGRTAIDVSSVITTEPTPAMDTYLWSRVRVKINKFVYDTVDEMQKLEAFHPTEPVIDLDELENMHTTKSVEEFGASIHALQYARSVSTTNPKMRVVSVSNADMKELIDADLILNTQTREWCCILSLTSRMLIRKKSKELGKYDLCRVVNARYFPDSTDPDRDYIRLIVLEAQRTHP